MTMSELKVTPESMPAIVLGGVRYSLFFSVYGVERWAEHRGVDYHQALADGWTGADLAIGDLEKLLAVALESGEARRVAFGGGEARTIGKDTIQGIFAVYSPIELMSTLADAWQMLPEGEPSPNPEAPHD